MKTYRQTKPNFVTTRMIAGGLLAVSVTSFGMIGPVLAQEAAPPPIPAEQSAPPPSLPPPLPGAQPPTPPAPADRAAQATSTSVRGTVSQYMMNPDGSVAGILLSDNTIVRFPPHMGQQLVQALKPQDLVTVDGFVQYQGTIHATTITNVASQQSVVDTPPSSQNPPPGPGREARQSISANGTIKVLTHTVRGEIDGAVLDNGTIVHFPPHFGTQDANLFQVGAPLAAVGYGAINIYGRSLEATSVGPAADHLQTVTANGDRRRRGPGERPHPIPTPAK